MEKSPAGKTIARLFQSIETAHAERNEPPPWTHHTHTRVRTAYGTYTAEELRTATPKQLSRKASAQVRDCLNERNKPSKPWKLEDLRPSHPKLQRPSHPGWDLTQDRPESEGHNSIVGSHTETKHENDALDDRNRAHIYSETLRHHNRNPTIAEPDILRLTYRLPQNWRTRVDEFRHGWVYTTTNPPSNNGAWSHEGTGAWFLNINNNC